MKNAWSGPVCTAVTICVLVVARQGASGQNLSFTTNGFAAARCVAAADVLGTGRPAVITGNYPDNSVSVFANFGNGTAFVSNSTYAVAASPLFVLAADVNNDGIPDIVSIGPTTTILTNSGFRSFGSNSTITVGGNCAVIFDLNNDGNLDLLIGGSTTVAIYTNNGKGFFTFLTNLPVPGTVYSMATADIDADGHTDLIVANYNAGNVTVFTNNGSGMLFSNATYAPSGRSVIAADINGDGYPDIITANGSSLSVLTNNGHGLFASAAIVSAPSGSEWLAAADFNGDGRIDLVTIAESFVPNIVTVFTNTGTGFASALTFRAGSGDPNLILAQDLNGDGKPDIIFSTPSFWVALNQTPFPTPALNLSSIAGQSALFWRDPSDPVVLQESTSLTNPNWLPVKGGTAIRGVTVSNTSPSLFFRLQSQ